MTGIYIVSPKNSGADNEQIGSTQRSGERERQQLCEYFSPNQVSCTDPPQMARYCIHFGFLPSTTVTHVLVYLHSLDESSCAPAPFATLAITGGVAGPLAVFADPDAAWWRERMMSVRFDCTLLIQSLQGRTSFSKSTLLHFS